MKVKEYKKRERMKGVNPLFGRGNKRKLNGLEQHGKTHLANLII